MSIEFCLGILFLIFICFFGFSINKSSDHADKKHEEAERVRNAYFKNGAVEMWKQNSDTFHLICELSPGEFGDWIITRGKNHKMFEKTVFIPKTGKLLDIHNWLSKKSIVRIYDLEKELPHGYYN